MSYDVQHILKVIFVCCFSLGIIFYGYYQSQDLIGGPKIDIVNPENGSVSESSFIEISGRALNIVRISLNDRSIFVDEEGNFTEKMLLLEGYNIMEVKAEDRFGRETKKILQIVHRPENDERTDESPLLSATPAVPSF
jgi:hypothetical protein